MAAKVRAMKPGREWAETSEAALLGGILLLGSEAFEAVRFALVPEDFGTLGFAEVFAAMAACHARGEVIEVSTVAAQMETSGGSELVGGFVGLAGLIDRATAHAITVHADIVVAASHRRHLLETLTRATERVAKDDGLNDPTTWRDFVASETGKWIEVARSGRVAGVGIDQATATIQAIAEIDTMLKGDKATGSYGMPVLDDAAVPNAGDLTLVCARPSVGKSAFCVSLTRECCFEWCDGRWEPRQEPIPIMWASAEMPHTTVIKRLISDVADIDGRALLRGDKQTLERRADDYFAAAKLVKNAPIHWVGDRTAAKVLANIERRVRAWRSRVNSAKPPIVIVDYLGMIKIAGHFDNKADRFSAIAMALKELAVETDTIVILVAALNREIEKRDGDHWPRLADLRDCGELEFHADQVIAVHRPVMHQSPPHDIGGLIATCRQIRALDLQGKTTEAQRTEWRRAQEKLREAWLCILKARNGAVGKIPTQYHRKTTRFDAPRIKDPS